MIRRKLFIATAITAAVAITGCDQRASSPTAPSSAATITANQSVGVSSSEESSRSGTLHMVKSCAQYTGLAGSFCTITSSDLKEMPAGTRIVYASALVGGVLDSDLYADPPGKGKSIAFGHVVLDLTISPPSGLVTFSGGTGKFKHFSATISVTPVSGFDWNWDGPYSFGKGN